MNEQHNGLWILNQLRNSREHFTKIHRKTYHIKVEKFPNYSVSPLPIRDAKNPVPYKANSITYSIPLDYLNLLLSLGTLYRS